MLIFFTCLIAMIAIIVILKQLQNARQKIKYSPTAMIVCGVILAASIAVFGVNLLKKDTAYFNDNVNTRLFVSHGYTVAQKIAPDYKQEKIAVLFQDSDDAAAADQMVEVIKQTLGGSAEVKALYVKAELKAKYAPEDAPSFNELVRAKDYNNLANDLKENDIIIIASALPKDANNMKLWNHKQKKKIYILNSPIPLDGAIEAKVIAGYTILDKSADFKNLDIPKDYAKAFSARFKLVTGKI